jgi:hypothetical protein
MGKTFQKLSANKKVFPKEKEVFQGEGIQKVVVQLPYKWGYVDSINRIQRGKIKVV